MGGELQDYTVDQAAGAIALTLGALGSLLLVIIMAVAMPVPMSHWYLGPVLYLRLLTCRSASGFYAKSWGLAISKPLC